MPRVGTSDPNNCLLSLEILGQSEKKFKKIQNLFRSYYFIACSELVPKPRGPRRVGGRKVGEKGTGSCLNTAVVFLLHFYVEIFQKSL